MFNPSELEGEIDHSFFDSDCDDVISRDGGKKMVKNSKTEENPPVQEKLQTKQTENAKDGVHLSGKETKKYLKPVKNDNSRGAGLKDISCQPKEKDRDRSFGTSTDSKSDQNFNHRDSGEEHNFYRGKFLNLLSREEDRNEDESSNETEEETSHAKCSSSKLKNVRSPKKLTRNRRSRTPCPSSPEASTDSDPDGSYSSSSGRSSVASPTLPRPDNPLSIKGRGTGVGLAASQDLRPLHTDSEDTVTDVSPLSSPDSSRLQSLDLNHTETEDGTVKEQEQESMPSSGLSNVPQDDDSNQDIDEYSLDSESQFGDRVVFHCPVGKNRKNYSFTNDEVRRIDRENQRLLGQLSRLYQGSRPGSAAGQKRHKTSNSPLTRRSHSALNRQREQQRIERENLAFLKRLETVKPTSGLKRSEQLADYQRQVGYLGGPSYPIFKSTTKKERPTSRTSSAGRGLRQSSAAHRSATAVSSSSKDPSDVPVPRTKITTGSRPAWC
ncbi:cilia- and flagella-associated protein 97 [Sphaeramia orbicularis]|uniref:cilia- and flagella-associated protein 97 n=1 Tax=Sphaeramia orbicularis TaxID=375764 RepID=UPI0011815067|nr:cilia- and flagella-associated protein 97 [Sphaeramia orbicularis]